MKLVVTLSARAEADLAGIARYIAKKSSARRAEDYVAKLRAECLSLAFTPGRGHWTMLRGLPVRSFGYKHSATIMFRSDKEKIAIVRILYRGRNTLEHM